MRTKILIMVIFTNLLFSFSVETQSIADIIDCCKLRVRISDFEVPSIENTGEYFTVNVTITNNRFLPFPAMIRIDLLDGLLNCIKKNIGQNSYHIFWGKNSETLEIKCIVREGDIDWYKEKYNVQAVLFRSYWIGTAKQWDTSTVRGIHINTRFCEKDKARINEIVVTDTIKEHKDWFNVELTLVNEGSFDALASVRIDMIERPSMVPELEQLDLLEGMATVRKELGEKDDINLKSNCPGLTINVPCYLRELESKKERFIIQAVLIVNIEGEEYQVDASTYFEIYHEQPFFREDNIPLIVGIIIGVLATIGFIALIVRIVYPLYYIKRKKLRSEFHRVKFDNKKGQIEDVNTKKRK